MHRPFCKSYLYLYLILIAIAFCACPGYAQLDRGGIVGTVTDLAGARITGAKVTVTNIAKNLDTVVESNAEGNYSVNNLQIGAYRVTAERSGFKTAVQTSVDVPVNQVVKVDLQ